MNMYIVYLTKNNGGAHPSYEANPKILEEEERGSADTYSCLGHAKKVFLIF